MANLPFPVQMSFFIGGAICVFMWQMGVRKVRKGGRDREERIISNLDRLAPYLPIENAKMENVDGNCCVCLGELPGGIMRKVVCGHVFHASCIERWILHSVERYLDVKSFVRSPHGFLVPGSPWPSCPLCMKLLLVIDETDIRDAISEALYYHNHNPSGLQMFG
mmetsp:Transcript_25466/g.100551  ORF Transcript_25466/g.100551 Transcript_25466/m.100551 type:complete len:164 (-) Transcript_25466:2320-2811(-)